MRRLWFKVDVGFFRHRKTAKAGPLAAYLFLQMCGYCKEFAPDGRVPKEVDFGKAFTRQHYDALVGVGFLHDEGDEWRVHQFAEWQTDTSKVSAARSKAGAKGAAARWQSNGNGDGNCHPGAEAKA